MEILIVDNSKLYTQILEHSLEPVNNQIHFFKQPEEALNSAQQLAYDYICVSYFLEQMDGIEFTRQLRLLPNYAHVPVILFASKKEGKLLDSALRAGITDIFFKEDDFQELVAHIVRFSQRKNKINAKVLLIEDTLSQQQMIRQILENAGLTVVAFENGTKAFTAFLQADFDLVITDILLEGHVTGVKLVNMIRRLNSEKGDVPILAVTAFDNLARKIDLYCRGISDYVQKPIIEEEFLSRVTNLINNQRLICLLREQKKTIEEASDDELSVMACAFETNDAILIADAYGNIIRSNQSFLKISGYTIDEVVGKNLWTYSLYSEKYDMDGEKAPEELIQTIKNHLMMSGSFWESHEKNKRKNGEVYDTRIKISATRNFEQEIRYYVVVFSDVSHDKETQERLFEREYYDPLTTLANRKLLMKSLESEFIKATSEHTYGILFFINLVRFKAINDSLGPDIGDKLLIDVANRLRNKVNIENGLASRIGGQKFVILLTGFSSDHSDLSSKAQHYAEEVNDLLCQTYVINEHSIHLNIHVGVSLFPSGQTSIHDIVTQAELANYSAVQDNTAISFFTESLQESVNQTAFIEQKLEQVLKNNELSVRYQPQYDQFSRLVGCEALLRWQHDGELIPPDLFIPIAEKTMQIQEIGQWVLFHVVGVVEKWRLSGKIISTFKMAINVSPIQCLQDGFIAYIEQLIEKFPETMKHIQLELTETIFVEKIEQVIEKMNQLKKMGVQIAIDDFGTGYSSLSYLTKLPISFLKIDKSFVQGINIDDNNEAIVETIISMAHHMGMQVIAEGVETKRQFLFLRNKNCEFYQGYLFSKPLNQTLFEELLYDDIDHSFASLDRKIKKYEKN